ncbi:hypothetical protein AB0M95_26645 [Sphaerisporangium sp. NPDC051017]|uniref:hypothetical protein n=1 Tax=Sphaerisporangium sp. NPDC051017 TaxID=3154636 RepID=UPI00341BAAC2
MDSDRSTVYHGSTSAGGGKGPDEDEVLGVGKEEVHALLGGLPRVFALVRDEGEEEIDLCVIAVGMVLPQGGATTLSMGGHGLGRWENAHRAATRLGCECVWLGEAG